MTPAARATAAIDILDVVLEHGGGVEAVIANWGRRNRYAGSSDRSAIRDVVYDALRRRRSLAAWGGAETGRGLVLGAVREAGRSVDEVFGAGRHAPPPLSPEERDEPHGPWPESVMLDCPDFVLPAMKRALGDRTGRVLSLMSQRADVHLRANLARVDPAELTSLLAEEGIAVERHPLSHSALIVREGARRLRQSAAFAAGLFDLQDAASQAISDAVPVAPGDRVLDFCAGAGGKTLAMAARVHARWFAHDANAARMRDLPERAARAGCTVTVLHAGAAAKQRPYDAVLVDAPCSGSGSWRRDPEAKWTLTPERLEELVEQQSGILDEAAGLVREGGVLAYATCSLLLEENAWQVEAFRRRHRAWTLKSSLRLTPLEGGDGFYLALLQR